LYFNFIYSRVEGACVCEGVCEGVCVLFLGGRESGLKVL
jgi:hypothetical protein